MERADNIDAVVGPKGCLRSLTGLIALLSLLIGLNHGTCGEAPSLNEYQVKALFLFNFAKYVEWPSNVWSNDHSPVTIGIVGDSKLTEELFKATEGKKIGERKIVILKINSNDELDRCHILFVCLSEKDRFAEILDAVRSKPVLTVGEADGFRKTGGVVNFVPSDGKIHFKINLDAAHAARLQISSKLLHLAEEVSGKP